jgi:protein gp37
MGQKTEIAWCDSTWSPVRGCTRVSRGCEHCYSERMAARRLPGLMSPTTGEPFATMTPSGPRWTGRVELIESQLEVPLRWRKPRRIFVNSMSDTFHEAFPDSAIDRIFAVMALCPQHTFMVLTKRAERMREYGLRCANMQAEDPFGPMELSPFRRVWLGVSVEDQVTADERIPLLLQTPAAVRFISLEPMLGAVDLTRYLVARSVKDGYAEVRRQFPADPAIPTPVHLRLRPSLDWVIVGGESGPDARPMHLDWARSVRDQCLAAGVPFFFKQICDARGRKIPFDQCPADLQIREFPKNEHVDF